MKRPAARVVAAAILAAGCRTIAPAPRVPVYLLDPRLGLSGPFPASVGVGWEAIQQRRWDDAARLFSGGGDSEAIGRTEALLGLGRLAEARAACAKSFERGVGTAPLFAACAEIAAREERWVDAYDLFEGAVLRLPENAGLNDRRRAAAPRAAQALLEKATAAMGERHPKQARAAAERALAIAPGSFDAQVLAGRAAVASGDSASAFAHLFNAWKSDPTRVEVGEQAASLASKLGRSNEALEILSALARTDPRFRGRAEEAREDFVISNWPARERDIARSVRLTRAGALTLLWKLLPQVRAVPSNRSVPVASDIVGRKDRQILSRSLQLGLIVVDPSTHRARPDAILFRAEAIRMLLRAAAAAGLGRRVDCVEKAPGGTSLAAAAAQCGLLSAGSAGSVSAREFRRAIDSLQQTPASGKGRK